MNKILDIFTEGETSNPTGQQGLERGMLKRGNVDKFFKKKQNRKFKGRGKVKKGRKSSGVGGGSKRRHNFKTQMARKILATRHGMTRALKKINNKFVMRYGEVAKFMRRNGYTFNRDVGKWFVKKNVKKDDKKNDDMKNISSTVNKSPENNEGGAETGSNSSSDTGETKKSLTSGPIKLNKTAGETIEDLFKKDKVTKPTEEKETIKSLEGRLYLFMQGKEAALEFKEENDVTTPNISPNDIISYMKSEYGMEWNEEYKAWVNKEQQFAFTNNAFGEDAKSIIARCILAEAGRLPALDIYEVGKKDLYGKMEELGYNWDEQEAKWNEKKAENLIARTLPEPVVVNKI